MSFTPENECGLDILYKYLCIHVVRKYRPSDEVLKMVRGFADAYENTMSWTILFYQSTNKVQKRTSVHELINFFFFKETLLIRNITKQLLCTHILGQTNRLASQFLLKHTQHHVGVHTACVLS